MNLLSLLPPQLKRITSIIARRADRDGLKAYLVGGIVRDLVLGRKNLDLDVVIEGPAPEFCVRLARERGLNYTLYPRFKTAAVDFGGGVKVDLATARSEAYPHPGALPVVTPADLRQDLLRRDITINTLALALHRGEKGRLIDVVSGLEDLKKGRVRILHDRSFIDDPTRILRVVRYEQRFGFRCVPQTLRLLKQAFQTGAVQTVKPPRYFAEFRRILNEDEPLGALKRLSVLKGYGFLGPAYSFPLSRLSRLALGIARLRSRPVYRDCRWDLVYLMGLLSALPGKRWENILSGFQLSRCEARIVLDARRAEEDLKMLKNRGLGPDGVYGLLSGRPLEIISFIQASSSGRILNSAIGRFLETDRNVRPLLSGDDIRAMRLVPARQTAEAVRALVLGKIRGNLKTRRQEQEFLRDWMRRRESNGTDAKG